MLNEDSLENQIQIASSGLRSTFDCEPTWIVAAPGRVNLMGEHVDYNDGFVLPMALQRYVVIAAAENSNSKSVANIRSLQQALPHSVDLSQPINRGDVGWHSYLDGVIASFVNLGHTIPGFNAVVSSSVPVGSGLSSSAALEVATATLIEAMIGTELTKKDKALLCQNAEHQFAGVPCGIMDQFSSVFGQPDQLMLLDCRSQQIEFVPFPAEVSVLITDSRVQRELAAGEYAQRRFECQEAARRLAVASLRDATIELLDESHELDATLYKRAKHVITEIERTQQFTDAVRNNDWTSAGRLMFESHHSMRDDFEISCPEIDRLVEINRELGESGGVYGARMTGGGFGGCTVSIVLPEKAAEISEQILKRYDTAARSTPHIFVSRPGVGAHVIVNRGNKKKPSQNWPGS